MVWPYLRRGDFKNRGGGHFVKYLEYGYYLFLVPLLTFISYL